MFEIDRMTPEEIEKCCGDGNYLYDYYRIEGMDEILGANPVSTLLGKDEVNEFFFKRGYEGADVFKSQDGRCFVIAFRWDDPFPDNYNDVVVEEERLTSDGIQSWKKYVEYCTRRGLPINEDYKDAFEED